MESKFRIRDNVLELVANGVKVIKSADFEDYLAADRVIREAVEKSKEIEQSARENYEIMREQGYQDGLNDAKAETAQTLTELTAEYADSVSSLQDALANILPSLVKKVVGSFEDSEIIIKLVNSTVSNLSAEKRLRLLVAPSLKEQIEARVGEILQQHPMIEFVEVIADPKLSDRVCELESETLSVRLDIDQQLEKIKTVVQNFLE